MGMAEGELAVAGMPEEPGSWDPASKVGRPQSYYEDVVEIVPRQKYPRTFHLVRLLRALVSRFR